MGLYAVETRNRSVFKIFDHLKIKKKNSKQTIEFMTAINNSKELNFDDFLNSGIAQIKTGENTISIDYEYEGLSIELSNLVISPEHNVWPASMTIKKGDTNYKTIEAIGKFRF